MARCAVYVRVSTEEQAQEGYSLNEQEKRCHNYVEMKGDTVFKVYRDEGLSGRGTRNRTAYLAMMAEADQWDKLVFWKLDRVHRNAKNFMAMTDNLKALDKEFASVVDNIDTDTAMGRFALDLFVRIAQLESEVIGERVEMGLRAKVEAGEWITRPPFGYDLIPTDLGKSRLEANEREVEVVRFIFKRHMEGQSPYRISQELIDECIAGKPWKTKMGKNWTWVQVKRILQNPVYTGKFRIKDPDHKSRLLYLNGKHNSVICMEDFLAVNPELRDVLPVKQGD